MPPHLHPKSGYTASLFATTLFASFFVVALPHILPCPAPRVAYADDGTSRPLGKRRRKRKCVEEENPVEAETEEEAESVVKRECPVPKPGVIVGEMLGFKMSSRREGRGERPP